MECGFATRIAIRHVRPARVLCESRDQHLRRPEHQPAEYLWRRRDSSPEFATFGRTAATNQYFFGFSSNYESLQAELTKRFSHGLALKSAFTWGKALGYINGDDGGIQFFINWRRNYAPLNRPAGSISSRALRMSCPSAAVTGTLIRASETLCLEAGGLQASSPCFRDCPLPLRRAEARSTRREQRRQPRSLAVCTS